MSTPKSAFEGTIDSVIGTFSLLWNWASAPVKDENGKALPEKSVVDFLPDSAAPKPDGQIPAQVVDTEGEDA